MASKQYYHQRLKGPDSIGLDEFRLVFIEFWDKFFYDGFFRKNFNFYGQNPSEEKIRWELKKQFPSLQLWPISESINNQPIDIIFSLIEFLHDNTSEIVDYESVTDRTGWNSNQPVYDDEKGKLRFREDLNPFLNALESGYELKEDGAIYVLVKSDYERLFEAKLPENGKSLPTSAGKTTEEELDDAKKLFLDKSGLHRKAAIQQLADILESVRTDVKRYIPDEESDIFNIANNFGIRHRNSKQKTLYDDKIWHTWMFYYYLSTIHAVLRLKEKYAPK